MLKLIKLLCLFLIVSFSAKSQVLLDSAKKPIAPIVNSLSDQDEILFHELELKIHKQDFIIGLVAFILLALLSFLALNKKNRQLSKMATFAENDPNPVLELDLNFKLKYCNEAAMKYANLVDLMHETHPLRSKFEYLLNKTISDKKTGKYIIEEPFVLDDTSSCYWFFYCFL